MKKISAFMILVLLMFSLFGCAAQKPTVRVAVLKGPTAIGAVKLMKDNDNKETKNDYTFKIAGANDEITAALSSGEVDIAAIATNLASSLYNKTKGSIQVVAVNTLGVLHILEKGNTIKSVADLKGKTIYSSGQGAVPEYVLNYILEANGLTVGKDVFVEYKAEHSELATLAVSGKAPICLLPEPFVSTVLSKTDMRIAIDVTKAYADAAKTKGESGDLTMGCLVARTEWIKKNEKALADFLSEYSESTGYAVKNISQTAQLCVDYGVIPSKEIAASAIPNCNIVYIDGDKMKTTLTNFLNVLYKQNPKSIGGKLPDEAFFYKK